MKWDSIHIRKTFYHSPVISFVVDEKYPWPKWDWGETSLSVQQFITTESCNYFRPKVTKLELYFIIKPHLSLKEEKSEWM